MEGEHNAPTILIHYLINFDWIQFHIHTYSTINPASYMGNHIRKELPHRINTGSASDSSQHFNDSLYKWVCSTDFTNTCQQLSLFHHDTDGFWYHLKVLTIYNTFSTCKHLCKVSLSSLANRLKLNSRLINFGLRSISFFFC